jgi:hypothetical protein
LSFNVLIFFWFFGFLGGGFGSVGPASQNVNAKLQKAAALRARLLAKKRAAAAKPTSGGGPTIAAAVPAAPRGSLNQVKDPLED